MGTVKTLKAKLIVILIVFMMLFSNFGFTLSAIAASDEFEVINRGFFRKDEIKFDAYFEDEDGNKITELTKNVNENIKLVLEILPQVEGFLQDGTIRAVSADGSGLGFKFSAVSQNLLATTKTESSLVEAIKGAESLLEEPKEEVEKIEDEKGEEPATDSNTNTVTVDSSIQSILDKVSDKVQQADSDVVKTNPLASIIDAIGEEILVDENVIVEDEEDEETYEDKVKDALLDIVIESENEILLSNIIEDTKIVVDLEFVPGEKLDINNLLEEVKLQLSGTFINKNLKEVKIGKEEKVVVGWDYSKDIVVSSEFSKFSPFSVMDVSGTIVQNDITITRNINDSKYLPVKSTTIEVDVPKINDQAPIEINVIANKTLATNGEDVGDTTFTKDNWSYDKENNKITIKTVNKEGNTAVYSHGEDQYVIIYRFKEYIKDEKYTLNNKAIVKVVEYSSDTNTITKKIDKQNEVEVKRDELLTSCIGTSSEKINKSKINANYNSGLPIYETEYKTKVNVNILTSDIFENLIIDATKEFYKNNNDLEFEAKNIKYKQVKFNYVQIKEILSAGGEIIIKNNNGELLYTLNKDLIKEENDCIINLNVIDGIFIEVNNIKKNGQIDFEITKAIEMCNYNREVFNDIKHIESRVDMSLKYIGIDERINLTTMATKKAFEDSYTTANLSMNKEIFSTIKTNANVEFKIELDNARTDRDLYANPSFEISFPKHVKEVNIKNVNLLHAGELELVGYQTYLNSDETIRIKIDLSGVQTRYNESAITNGTNIVINADIIVDPFTSNKKDQIKLYYCNESVSNYMTQTKWSIEKVRNNNVIKTTNGYDAKAIEFQGPNGLIAINTIKNYDGNNSVLTSFRQGLKTQEIPREGDAVRATMELVVLNNTNEQCVDAVLLGRLPFKGNKDVVTGEDLGTTVNAKMTNKIMSDPNNTNSATIYYSQNENADRNLNNEANDWSYESINTEYMKSYMIVVDGVLEPGAMLKYRYEFEVPSNLGYEAKILGSFGAFYNKKTENLILKENVSADKVGLVTEVGARLETKMSVDVGNGTDIGEARYLTYKVTVENTGSVILRDVKVECERPTYSMFCVESSNPDTGNDGYVVSNAARLSKTFSEIKIGEKIEFKYLVKTGLIPENIDEYVNNLDGVIQDPDGYYVLDEENKKVYITEIPKDFYVEHSAKVTSATTPVEYETNTIKNKLVHSNFDIQTTVFNVYATLNSGNDFIYVVDVYNITDETIKDIVVEDVLPRELKYLGLKENTKVQYETEFDEETNTLKVLVGELKPLETARFYIQCNIANIKNEGSKTIFNHVVVKADGDIEEKSTVLEDELIGPELEFSQQLATGENSVDECKEFSIIVNAKNNGKGESKQVQFDVVLPEELKLLAVISEGNRPVNIEKDGNTIKATVARIDPNDYSSLIIKTRSHPIDGSIELKMDTKVSEEYIGELAIEDLNFWIVEDENRELTDDEKQEIADKNTIDNPTADDSYKQDVEDEQSNTTTQPDVGEDDSNSNVDNSNNQNTENGNQSNSSNNSSNNNHNNLDNDTNDDVNDDTNDESNNQNTYEKTFKVSGEIWKDENSDGVKDDDETRLRKIKVSLYQGNNEIKTCVTDSLGKYRFEGVKVGSYIVTFEYNSDVYVATEYKKGGVPEDRNSDVIETAEGIGATNTINVVDTDLVIDCGIKVRDDFDISVEKYISKSTVTRNGKEKVAEYDDASLEKLEIRSKELNDTSIALEYKIVVSNNGNVAGYVGEIKDYLPSTLSFDESINEGWLLGKDGVLYNETLKDTLLKSGETKELKLVLNKVMTEDNTGTIVNKVEITNLTNDESLEEKDASNNVATQELLITVSTGRTVQVMLLIACIAGFAVIFNFTNIKTILTGKRIYK